MAPAELIARTAASIEAIDERAAASAERRQGRLTKPPGSLGRLEALATRIAGMTGDERPRLHDRLVVVAAADHGIAARGVSAFPPEVTEVIETLRARPEHVDVIMTGRDAAPELVEFADLVTDMTEVKHPFQSGIKAQPGIDY